jgi:hypothetical protein
MKHLLNASTVAYQLQEIFAHIGHDTMLNKINVAYLAQAMMTVCYAKTKVQKISDDYKKSLKDILPNGNFIGIDNLTPTYPISEYKLKRLEQSILEKINNV